MNNAVALNKVQGLVSGHFQTIAVEPQAKPSFQKARHHLGRRHLFYRHSYFH
jgi:hypothetical protein